MRAIAKTNSSIQVRP